jgi:hypothetical protein
MLHGGPFRSSILRHPWIIRSDRGQIAKNMRARIQEVAEEHFRRIGHQKTSVADIASELGISRANVYRFFLPGCNQGIHLQAGLEKYRRARPYDRTQEHAALGETRGTPDRRSPSQQDETVPRQADARPIVAAMQENRPVVKVHAEQMMTILEAIIREGLETGQFEVEDPAEAARGQDRVYTVLPSGSDRAPPSTRRRHRSGLA